MPILVYCQMTEETFLQRNTILKKQILMPEGKQKKHKRSFPQLKRVTENALTDESIDSNTHKKFDVMKTF